MTFTDDKRAACSVSERPIAGAPAVGTAHNGPAGSSCVVGFGLIADCFAADLLPPLAAIGPGFSATAVPSSASAEPS